MSDLITTALLLEMETACLAVEHKTHTALVRYAETCTPERVISLIDGLRESLDEELLLNARTANMLAAITVLRTGIEERDAQILRLSAEVLTLGANLAEATATHGLVELEIKTVRHDHD